MVYSSEVVRRLGSAKPPLVSLVRCGHAGDSCCCGKGVLIPHQGRKDLIEQHYEIPASPTSRKKASVVWVLRRSAAASRK